MVLGLVFTLGEITGLLSRRPVHEDPPRFSSSWEARWESRVYLPAALLMGIEAVATFLHLQTKLQWTFLSVTSSCMYSYRNT